MTSRQGEGEIAEGRYLGAVVIVEHAREESVREESVVVVTTLREDKFKNSNFQLSRQF